MGKRGDIAERHVVVFDYDGTLADTKAGIIATATTVLTRWGLSEEDLANVGDIIGPPFPEAYELVFGLSHEDAVEVTRQYREIYHKRDVEAWPAFPGVAELLRELRAAGKVLAVASSKTADLVRRGLADNEIAGLFDVVCAKERDGESTKADAIGAALATVNATPDDAVMVGDRFHDVEAAKACGVPCVGVLYGKTADRVELEDAGAVAVTETVDELRELLLGQ